LVFNVLQTNQSAAGTMHDTPFALVGVLSLCLPEKQGLYLLPNKGQRVLQATRRQPEPSTGP
jgi:hypothetical protein